MRTLRFHDYGEPADVLRLEDAPSPEPGPGQIRIAVQACGLTPADWALCGGLFQGELPRGIGLEVAGTVDAIGDGVTGVQIGDDVFGPAPFRGPSAGASEQAVLDIWFPRPAGLDPVATAALPMAVETAYRSLTELGVGAGDTLLVHGAGTTVGYAAVQIGLQRAARVFATAGDTHADALRALGADVTGYGDGMVERVSALAGGPVDFVLDTAPPGKSMADLAGLARKPDCVLSCSDPAGAAAAGVRFNASTTLCNHVLGDYAQLAAAGRFSIPVAGTFALDDWRTPLALSRSGRPGGKLVLLIG